jgi:hypothetical protein
VAGCTRTLRVGGLAQPFVVTAPGIQQSLAVAIRVQVSHDHRPAGLSYREQQSGESDRCQLVRRIVNLLPLGRQVDMMICSSSVLSPWSGERIKAEDPADTTLPGLLSFYAHLGDIRWTAFKLF